MNKFSWYEAKSVEDACALATAFVAPVRESLDNMG